MVKRVETTKEVAPKAAIFFQQSMGTKNGSFTKDYLIFHLSRSKNQSKKVCNFGCQSCFLSLFFLQTQLIYDSVARNNYPDLPH